MFFIQSNLDDGIACRNWEELVSKGRVEEEGGLLVTWRAEGLVCNRDGRGGLVAKERVLEVALYIILT